jgi:hypothetical protein
MAFRRSGNERYAFRLRWNPELQIMCGNSELLASVDYLRTGIRIVSNRLASGRTGRGGPNPKLLQEAGWSVDPIRWESAWDRTSERRVSHGSKRSKFRASHAGGRRFESCRAHHSRGCESDLQALRHPMGAALTSPAWQGVCANPRTILPTRSQADRSPSLLEGDPERRAA